MKDLEALRAAVTTRLGEFRAKHVLSVEAEAAELSRIFLPQMEESVRISALLHDITKEYTTEEHLAVFAKYGEMPDRLTLSSPKTLHALTAALLIPSEFPEYAFPEVISAVKHHTTGCADMSLLDCLIYLADYIEPTRRFDDCRRLRSYFWDGLVSGMPDPDKKKHLWKTMVMSFDLTIENLIAEKRVIAPDTVSARNAFLQKLAQAEETE